MPDPPETGNDLCETVELLATQVAGLEQVANEPGVSHTDPSTSETIEMTLLQAVAALRRLRNSRRPVNKLPSEILSHIFSFVHHSGDNLDNISYQFGLHTIREPVALLVPLLSVCSRWRSIVTTSSLLWSTIDNRSILDLAISSKYRPVNGPLDVHIVDNFFRPAHVDYDRDPQALPVFLEHNSTLVEVLRNEGHRIRAFFAEIPTVLLPALTDFPGESLRACELWPSPLEHAPDGTGAIRPLFSACTPNLRALVIGNLVFIPSNHFPSLTHLILAGGVGSIPPDRSLFTFIDFMLLLSRCPNLQVLHLSDIDVIPLQELPDDRILVPVNLQCLRKFSNEEVLLDQTGGHHLPYLGPQFRRALLTHLELSPDCVVWLATILPDDLEGTLHCLPFDNSFTSVYLGAHDPRQPKTRALNAIEPECFSIMATDPPRQRGVRIDFQMPGRCYSTGLTTELARARVLDAIRSAPLLSEVRELWVVPTANTLLSEPDSLLAGFPNLTTLVLGLMSDPLALVRVVTAINGTETDSELMHTPADWEPLLALEVHGDLAIPCPRLRTVCVYGLTERQAMLLYSVVLSRGEAGCPIRRLVVGFYEPPEDNVLDLVEGLCGLVEDFTLIRHGERCPDDLLWVHRLPPVCRDSSEHNAYWPAWM